MKKSADLISHRAGIATALCLSFLIYPPLRRSSNPPRRRRGVCRDDLQDFRVRPDDQEK